MFSHSDSGLADVIGVFNTASGYFDDLLSNGGPCFAQIVGPMCPTELQLNRAGPSGAAAPWTWVALFRQRFVIDGTTLIFLTPLPMVYTFHNLFVLQEYVLMLMTSTIEIIL